LACRISAMALMPMPPMPRMWRGPISPGICIPHRPFHALARRSPDDPVDPPAVATAAHLQAQTAAATNAKPLRAFCPAAYQLLDEVGEAQDSVGPALALRRCCGLLEQLGRLQQAADRARQTLGRQLLLGDEPARPRRREPAGVLQLIIIDGVRQGHE